MLEQFVRDSTLEQGSIVRRMEQQSPSVKKCYELLQLPFPIPAAPLGVGGGVWVVSEAVKLSLEKSGGWEEGVFSLSMLLTILFYF